MSIAPPSTALPVLRSKDAPPTKTPRIALIGNPNAGKTSLFNLLTGLRAKTANFPGTTVEHRRGRGNLLSGPFELVDLPGMYSLDATTPDEQVSRRVLLGELAGQPQPDAVLLVVDATNLQRSLFLAGQVLELGLPTVLAVNLIDAADKEGLQIDYEKLSAQLGCPVVPVSARKGWGIDELREDLQSLVGTPQDRAAPVSGCGSCGGCAYAARFDWAEQICSTSVDRSKEKRNRLTESIDRVLTHRMFGLAALACVMVVVFMAIFWVAQFPMEGIDALFAWSGATVATWLPAGQLNSLISDGLIAGVGGMLVFLPQICLLFFLLAILEDTGYMARAAFVMDRLMHRVGLPGKAFLPMLSAHACAIPAIMSSRVIEDRRDRLVTILVLPLMTCSARVPVYTMVVALLFPHSPVRAALLFAGAYALGIVAALSMAWLFKKTVLPGETRPLVIELPNYRMPSLRNALLTTWDRSRAFVQTAGTTILIISLVMWALATYPRTTLENLSADEQSDVAQLRETDEAAADAYLAQAQLDHSFAGRAGRFVLPVFEPLGFDWRMSVGVVSSFAAREVIVSTLAVLYGLADDPDENADSLYDTLRSTTHPDGSEVFTPAACLSLLVFYVLAMQCLPTQVVTKRETGTWKWAFVQIGYMSVLAYVAAFIAYQSAKFAGLG